MDPRFRPSYVLYVVHRESLGCLWLDLKKTAFPEMRAKYIGSYAISECAVHHFTIVCSVKLGDRMIKQEVNSVIEFCSTSSNNFNQLRWDVTKTGNGEWGMGNGELKMGNTFFTLTSYNNFFSGNYQYPRFIFKTSCAKIRGYNGRSHPALFLYFTIPEA